MPRATFAFVTAVVVWGWSASEPPRLPSGLYEVRFRLELPHLERWATEEVEIVCLPAEGGTAPIPVLSGNMPFSGCPARNLVQDGQSLTYEIACEGRETARARASYVLLPKQFSGRIAVTLGGKNMTMTEIQKGRRVGSCHSSPVPAP